MEGSEIGFEGFGCREYRVLSCAWRKGKDDEKTLNPKL